MIFKAHTTETESNLSKLVVAQCQQAIAELGAEAGIQELYNKIHSVCDTLTGKYDITEKQVNHEVGYFGHGIKVVAIEVMSETGEVLVSNLMHNQKYMH